MPICFRLFEHCARRAASRAACTAGSSKATPIGPPQRTQLAATARTTIHAVLDELRPPGGLLAAPAGRGTVTVWPQRAHGPLCPAYCSSTLVCAPQCGQVNGMAMLLMNLAKPIRQANLLKT